MATGEQQVLQKHYQGQITTLLQQLDAALAALPISTQAISRSLPAAASILGHVEKSTEDSWATLGGCLRIIWQRPGGVTPDHVARHKNGALQSCSRLLHRVGADKMALLDDKDRLEAINWLSAYRDAALASPAHVATPIHSAASVGRVKSATQPPEARARGGRAASTSSVSKTSVAAEKSPSASKSTTRDAKPVIKRELSDEAPRRAPLTSAGPALAWAAPLPPPSSAKRALVETESASSPKPAESTSRSTTTDRAPAPTRPKSKSITHPPTFLAIRLSPSVPDDGTPPTAPAAKKRKTTTTPSSSPPPPPPEKKGSKAAAAGERPQRQRKATKKLDEVEEVEARELIKAASEDGRHDVGEAVLGKFPNYSWWPALILDPSEAPEWTQGTQKLGSYLCKSIPTGGDHRWISPSDIRELDSKEVEESIMPNKYESPPPVSWKQYRADLIEGCLIAMDEEKLKEWADKPTESDTLRHWEMTRKGKLKV